MKKSMAFVFCLGLSLPAQATLLGIQFSGNVFDIDPATGAGVAIGSTGFQRQNAAASNSSGVFYTTSQASTANVNGTLLTVDPVNGAGTIVTTLSDGSLNGARGLAFDGLDVLYAIYDTGPFQSVSDDSLYTIDLNTGALNLIGPTGRRDLQGLAFASDGTLYAWDIFAGLTTLDVTTGSATLIGGSRSTDLQALEFGPDGTFYGARNELYTIDPTSGIATLIGGNNGDIRGLAFVEPIPVPAAVWLFGSGLIGLVGLARRKKA